MRTMFGSTECMSIAMKRYLLVIEFDWCKLSNEHDLNAMNTSPRRNLKLFTKHMLLMFTNLIVM